MDLPNAYSPLEPLLKKSQLLSAMTAALREMLPASYSDECVVINYRASTVVLGFHHAAALTSVRLQSKGILQTLQTLYPELSLCDIEYKVTPVYENTKPVLKPLQPIPSTAKTLLKRLLKKT
jgi:hypothetical protein